MMWIKSYLQSRKQKTFAEGGQKDELPLNAGAPHVSFLGSYYINDIADKLEGKNIYRQVILLTVDHRPRTSDGGNGNHSVSLPIILIKIKVDQMLPSSYISSLLVSSL